MWRTARERDSMPKLIDPATASRLQADIKAARERDALITDRVTVIEAAVEAILRERQDAK